MLQFIIIVGVLSAITVGVPAPQSDIVSLLQPQIEFEGRPGKNTGHRKVVLSGLGLVMPVMNIVPADQTNKIVTPLSYDENDKVPTLNEVKEIGMIKPPFKLDEDTGFSGTLHGSKGHKYHNGGWHWPNEFKPDWQQGQYDWYHGSYETGWEKQKEHYPHMHALHAGDDQQGPPLDWHNHHNHDHGQWHHHHDHDHHGHSNGDYHGQYHHHHYDHSGHDHHDHDHHHHDHDHYDHDHHGPPNWQPNKENGQAGFIGTPLIPSINTETGLGGIVQGPSVPLGESVILTPVKDDIATGNGGAIKSEPLKPIIPVPAVKEQDGDDPTTSFDIRNSAKKL